MFQIWYVSALNILQEMYQKIAKSSSKKVCYNFSICAQNLFDFECHLSRLVF